MRSLATLRLHRAIRAAAYAALMAAASHAVAGRQALELGTQTGINDGQSGIELDTRTGIHDGKSGLILQNAPLSPAPMVPANRLPTIDPVDAGAEQPPIVVAPYIALPGSNGTVPAGAAGYRMVPGSRQ